MDDSEALVGRVRDAFSLSLFHANAALQRGAAALLRGDREASGALCDLLHRLVGTAASLGFDPLSARCRALEVALLASEDRWYSKLVAAIRTLDEASAPMQRVALVALRAGSARALWLYAPEPIELALQPSWPIRAVASVTACPDPPRGALLVDARRDAMARVRSARAVWGQSPLVAIAPGASEADVLLSLRAGADFVHRGALSLDALSLSAWAALPPPFAHGAVLVLDSDPLRSSALRAAIEPLGARLAMIDARAQLEAQLRTLLPHVAVIDAAHPDAAPVAAVLAQHGASVSVVSIGDAPWSAAVVGDDQPFEELLAACVSALQTSMGPEEAAGFELGASTQTLRLSRADVQSALARKEPTRP